MKPFEAESFNFQAFWVECAAFFVRASVQHLSHTWFLPVDDDNDDDGDGDDDDARRIRESQSVGRLSKILIYELEEVKKCF